MSRHTPGPWSTATVNAGDSNVSRTALGIVGPTSHSFSAVIARMPAEYAPTHAIWPTCEANARLIAAAPDLLAALNGMLFAFNVKEIDPLIAFASIEQARAAIERAERGSK